MLYVRGRFKDGETRLKSFRNLVSFSPSILNMYNRIFFLIYYYNILNSCKDERNIVRSIVILNIFSSFRAYIYLNFPRFNSISNARRKCTDRWYIKNYAQNLNINTCSGDRESIKEGCIYIHRSDIYAVIRKESSEKLF